MKNILTILMLVLIGNFSFGQKTPSSYVNYEERVDNSENPLITDNRISQITFNSKTEFEFRSFPIPSSCLTWREYRGTWEKKNDTIFFYDQYRISENDVHFTFSNKNQNKFYLIDFQTDKKSRLTEKSIEIQFIYDIEADLKAVTLNMKLDNNCHLKIPFSEIPNLQKLASIRYKYFLPNGENRNGFITENNTINVKESKLPNYIGITFIEKPKKETIYRTTKAILIDDKIKVISKEKNKSDLPDFTGEIEFKEIYKKKS